MKAKGHGRTSPMKKLTHAGTRLASAAAETGSRLVDSASTAVAQGAQLSSAVASRAETYAAARSPEKRTPGGGIRERIHKFDAASRSDAGGGGRNRHQWPHRAGRERERAAPSPRRGGRGEDEEDEEAEADRRGFETKVPPPMSPPRNPSFCEKENRPNRFAERDGAKAKKSSPTSRRTKSRQRRREEEATSSPFGPNCDGNEREVWRRDAKRSDGFTGKASPYQRDGIDDANLADPNRAAVVPSRTEPDRGRRDAAAGPPFGEAFGVRGRKRDSSSDEVHPLIRSPLRKHIRGVRDSACSNAACTVVKAPFPLLPPEPGSRPLAAAAGWDRADGGAGGRAGTIMGAVAGTAPTRAAEEGRVEGEEGGKDYGEEALDLLTSAAFLFQHSRRNLR
ncbi:hypothetical protein ACHAWF_009720 [Thalassiosira exigua]